MQKRITFLAYIKRYLALKFKVRYISKTETG